MAKKSSRSKNEQRALRMQQMIFVALGLIVILSMVISLIAK
jgi:hypothetical protein